LLAGQFKNNQEVRKMAYAYKDRGGIIHIVEKKVTAQSSAVSDIIETTIPHAVGYPLASVIKNDKKVQEEVFIDCDLHTIYLGGNGNHGKGRKVALSSLPADLQKLAVDLGFKA